MIGNASLVAASVAVVGSVALLLAVRRVRRARADALRIAASEGREDLPRSLHPVIDPDVCIGSLSCLKSCPEGDILGVFDGSARLIHGDHCIGHGRCAAECPVGAIQLVFGTSRRGVDLPEVDATFESSRPGVHVVGELGGMGLIRNAMIQGLECVEHVAGALQGSRPPSSAGSAADVVIVGAGPAGLAAALAATDAGLSYRLLEQSTLGGTVAHFPRQKVVMTDRVRLPIVGSFGKRRMSKEELIESFRGIAANAAVSVEEGVRVTGIEGRDGDFTVTTDRGAVRGRKVVLAVGRRGTPRRLAVPGEDLPKVTYALSDAAQYQGADVLVVGGGDAAVEAALQLAEAGARTTVSYRGAALARCREANRARVDSLARDGRLHLLLSSSVRAIGARDVTLDVAGRAMRIPNAYVVVQIGGELPLELLSKAGVALRRYHGEAPASRRAAGGGRWRTRPASALEDPAQRRRDRMAALALTAAGALILALLAWKGRHYYLLPARARMASPLHRSLRSAGAFGHGVGIVATAFMLSNFLYAARKHFRFMKGWGRIGAWLRFHVFVGFMSPLVIAFHAAFQSRNQLATVTAASLVVVVLTGIVGRYVYALVPSAGEKVMEIEELQGRFVRSRDTVEPLVASARDPARLRAILERAAAPPATRSVLVLLLAWPVRALRSWLDLRGVPALAADRATGLELRDALRRLQRLSIQIRFYRSLKRLLGSWRLFHGTLATFLVLVIAAHIGVALYLGYGLRLP